MSKASYFFNISTTLITPAADSHASAPASLEAAGLTAHNLGPSFFHCDSLPTSEKK
jgi:hypothetical protein